MDLAARCNLKRKYVCIVRTGIPPLRAHMLLHFHAIQKKENCMIDLPLCQFRNMYNVLQVEARENVHCKICILGMGTIVEALR